MNPPAVVFMGTPDFAAIHLRHLLASQYEIKGVVTPPDKPAGRGRKLRPSAVKEVAVAHGLPVLQPASLKSPVFTAQLKALSADVFVVVAFRMLPQVVWEIPPLGTLNVHASLLPDYRGAAPINHVLINGETRTGVTTFLIDQAIDTGDILLRREVPVAPDDTAGSLHDKLAGAGKALLQETLDGLAAGSIKPQTQSSLADKGLHAAPKIYKDDCQIHWEQPAQQVHNFIRGLSPYPAAWTPVNLKGRPTTAKIYLSRLSPKESPGAGIILQEGRNSLLVGTADRCIEILQIHPQGKRKMDIQAFLQGYPVEEIEIITQ